ncbi:formyltransferase family protein [Pseudomonas corrugata]
MRISFLCSDILHPVNDHLLKWIEQQGGEHQVELVRQKKELSGGEILFLISCAEIIGAEERSAYQACLVLHASDLPHGRGWSPHIWQLIEGVEELTLSLLEAEDKVDSGRIWQKVKFLIPKHALWDEINKRLFDAEIELIDLAVHNFDAICPTAQDSDIIPTYYPRRSPSDSRIDPMQNITSQFDKIRVCDPNRFPAFFEMHGNKYKITLEKISE